MKKYKLVKISNILFGKSYNEERKDYIIEQLKDQIELYKYFPERLQKELEILQDEINNYNFIGMNKECYAYKVTMEKLKLIKSIFFNYKWGE